MVVISGRYGQARFAKATVASGGDTLYTYDASPTVMSSITSWSLENTVTNVSYIASNTRGYSGKLEGLHSATGNIAGLGGCAPLMPGQRFMFEGFVGPDSGILDDTTGTVYSIAAIVNSITININYQWTNPITWQIGWQSDWKQTGDELTHSEVGFWDMSDPPVATMMPSQSQNLEIYNESDQLMADACLVDANIQFQTDVATFANSCSAKAGGWQSGVVGSTNCTMNTNIHGNSYAALSSNHLPGKNSKVKLYVEGGEDPAYWEFEKMFFGTFGGLNVDVTTNTPLQFSCAMEFNAFPGGQPGYIKYYPGKDSSGQMRPYVNGIDDYFVNMATN